MERLPSASQLAALTTEAVDPRFSQVDTLSVAQAAKLMNEADAEVARAIEAELPSIISALEAATAQMRQGGRLIYVGAGTPGRIGVLDASECPPTFSTPPEQVRAIIAGGPAAVTEAMEGVEDDRGAGSHAIDAENVGPLDTVVGITSSGRTPFVLGAMERANAIGAVTIGIANNPNSQISSLAHYPIEVITGPEIISGSTRLKAGTSQKLILNMFSTIIMIQLGKTYKNFMVDVNATNEKLRERAIRMVCTITGVSYRKAEIALSRSGFHVKNAILYLERGLEEESAVALLERLDGNLRAALKEEL